MDFELKENIKKHTVKELKMLIKLFKKQQGVNITGMKKAELIDHFEWLLINGQLKSKHKKLIGAGFFDFFRPIKQDYNNGSKKMIEQYGDKFIDSIEVKRTPIMKILDKVINFISLGTYNKAKNGKFDDLFHLAMIVKIGSNNIVVEKNEVINISKSYSMTDKTETIPVPMNGQKLTLRQLLDNSERARGKEQYFFYNGIKNNCQDAVISWLKSSKLGNPQVYEWVKQDITEIVDGMPSYVSPVMNAVTNLGARVNALRGKGHNNNVKTKSKMKC